MRNIFLFWVVFAPVKTYQRIKAQHMLHSKDFELSISLKTSSFSTVPVKFEEQVKIPGMLYVAYNRKLNLGC